VTDTAIDKTPVTPRKDMSSRDPIVPTKATQSAVAISPSAAGYVAHSLSPATRRAYASGLRDFESWAVSQRLAWLPAEPETVASYLAHLADTGRSPSTISQRVAAIRWAHEAQDLPSPTASKGVRSTMAGIRRKLGTAPNRKAPATPDHLLMMVSQASDDLLGLRDRALMLFGFASALRRSELVALDIADLERTDRGLLVTVRRSKTDQEGAGRQVAIVPGRSNATCPITALDRWLESAEIKEGRVFRSVSRHGSVGDSLGTRAVGEIVKRLAAKAGLDPERFGGHSLRAGFVTAAADRGAPIDRIMDVTGHTSASMIRVYTRRSDAFQDHAGEGLL
jgi:site-specific recombinase XerD